MKKKRSIILTALTVAFAVSASAFTALGGFKKSTETVNAAENNNAYWEKYIDVSSENPVTFTSSAELPDWVEGGAYEYETNGGGTNTTGLGVAFTKTTTLTYKIPVLVESLTKDVALFEYFIAPEKESPKMPNELTDSSDVEFSKVVIRINGVENPNEFIEVEHLRRGFYIGESWIRSRSHTATTWAGWKDDDKDKLKTEESQGVLTKTSFNGSWQSQNKETLVVTKYPRANAISYDYINNATYTTYDGFNEKKNDDGVIREYDNSLHMAKGDKTFESFKSKSVTVSITFDEITAGKTAHVYLSKILGHSVIGEEIEDNIKPVISLPEDCELNKAPKGEAGQYYPFWDVLGFDSKEGNISNKLSYSVKYVVNSLQTEPVENDGAGFTPNKVGTYKVTVSLIDSTGNEAEIKTVNVDVKALIEPVSLTFTTAEPFPSTGLVGSKIKLPEYTVTGGSGTPNVDIQVTYNNKTETASVKNGEFELANAGIYNISYVATDFIGKKCERNFAIKANISKAPVIGDVVLPTVYKQGSLMVLNLPTAYDYHSFSGLGKEVPVKIYAASYASGTEITDDDYKEVKLKNGRYEFTPSKTADRVKIRYEATTLIDNNTEKKYSDEIVLVKSKTSDNKNIDIINYWYYNADDVEILNETVSSNKSEQSFKIKNEGTELKYVIPTEANSFSLGLSTSKSSARFEKITINLRDSVNINQVLSLVVTAKDKNNLLISTMQGDEGVVAGKIANAIEESLVTLRYKDGQILDEKLNVLFGVTKYDNGDEFNGFDSNKVYVSVTFNEMLDDAKEPSVVKFKNFYSVTKYEEGKKDASSPTIKLDGHISQYSYYLDTVVIPTAKAYDLCSPYCDVTVSVTDPDGEFVIGNASADKEYSFTFTKYGTYVVTYTSKNELNKSRNSITNINVLDKDAPVIEINGQIKTNYKVGEVLTLPTYSVTDNVCETKDIYKYIYLETPTFGYKTIACGNDVGTYIFQAPGKYTLVYFAMDNTSNFAYKTFDITVTV